jgi:nucleotide-binding universal stress UspA family protein
MSTKKQCHVTVVGIDFTELSDRALDQALEASGLYNGEVHVLYVEPDRPIEAVLQGTFMEAVSTDAALEQVRQRATERIAAVTKQRGSLSVSRVIAHFRRGSPAHQIAQLAADFDADLVVVGSHGRHGMERLVLGSVADRVSRLARCPVWIVRPKNHVGGMHVPEIEPPCPDCVTRRSATNGKELWCARHAEHHIRAHGWTYVSNPMYAESSQPYEATPEHGA